jgi:hypothetical protein
VKEKSADRIVVALLVAYVATFLQGIASVKFQTDIMGLFGVAPAAVFVAIARATSGAGTIFVAASALFVGIADVKGPWARKAFTTAMAVTVAELALGLIGFGALFSPQKPERELLTSGYVENWYLLGSSLLEVLAVVFILSWALAQVRLARTDAGGDAVAEDDSD